MNFRMPDEVRRVSGPTRWTSVTDYAITSLTAVQADLVLLAAPTRSCRRSTDELVTEHEDLDVLDCVAPGEQRQPAQHSVEHQVRETLLLIVKPRLQGCRRWSAGVCFPCASSVFDRLAPLVGVNLVRPRCAAGAAG
jgi:hypothetical protein